MPPPLDMREAFRVAAPFYDGDYASIDWSADIPLYVALARETGGPVLEMGCGTGRVLIPTARAGVDIHGLDLSPDMLEVCRGSLAKEPEQVQARVSLSCGDMRTFDAGSRFALITAPFRVAQVLVAREDQRAWLANVRRHLVPGGLLCFDVFHTDYKRLGGPGGPFQDVDRLDAATGHRIQRVTHVVPHNAGQTIEIHMRWLVDDALGTRVQERQADLLLRWFAPGELLNLMELAGFRIRAFWGTFGREPFGDNSPEQVILAEAG